MSEELIRRSDAIKALHGEAQITGKENAMAVQHLIGRFTFNIANIPSVDIIEPKRGEWAKRTHNTLIAQVNFAYCSECGQPIMHEHTRPLWNFCPNCGALMVRGEDDE